MNKLKYSTLFLLGILTFISCSSIRDHPWTQAIPEDAPFVILPEDGATLQSVLDSSRASFLDDITVSAFPLLSEVDSATESSAELHSIILFPGTDNKLHTIWMANVPSGFLETLQETFHQDFAQNQYYFDDIKIYKLHVQDRNLFAAELSDMAIISESSLGVEEVIRAYTGQAPRATIDDLQPESGSIVMNTP